MQIHKIRQYNLKQLVIIFWFRSILYLRQLWRMLVVFVLKTNYYPETVDGELLLRLSRKMETFYNFVLATQLHVEMADKCISGKMTIFGFCYQFDYNKDWLKDPISGNNWPSSKYCLNCPFVIKGYSDVKYILELNKLNHLVYYAIAFYHTKDDKYIIAIEKELTAWKNSVRQEKSVANRIVMDLAYRTINLIQISLLCSDSQYFRNEIFPTVLGIVNQHEGQMWYYASSRWNKAGNSNNHDIGELVGLYISQIWLSQFGIGNYKKKIDQELSYLSNLLDSLVAPSGAYMEQSGNYSRVVAEFLMIFCIVHDDIDNKRNISFLKKNHLGRLVSYISKLNSKDGLFNFGDNDDAQVLLSMSENGRVDYLINYCLNKGLLSDATDFMDASQWLYTSKDENQVQIFTRVGKFAYFVEGAYIHAHNDILSVLINIKGTALLVDKGCLFYNSGFDTKRKYNSTSAHNTVSFEGYEMAEFLPIGYKNYPFSQLHKSLMTSSSCYFEGELSYSGINHRRRIKYENSSITIEDIVETSKMGMYGKLSYLFNKKMEVVRDNNKYLIYEEDNVPVAEFLFFNIEQSEIIDTEYSPSYGQKEVTSELICKFISDKKKSVVTKINIL